LSRGLIEQTSNERQDTKIHRDSHHPVICLSVCLSVGLKTCLISCHRERN